MGPQQPGSPFPGKNRLETIHTMLCCFPFSGLHQQPSTRLVHKTIATWNHPSPFLLTLQEVSCCNCSDTVERRLLISPSMNSLSCDGRGHCKQKWRNWRSFVIHAAGLYSTIHSSPWTEGLLIQREVLIKGVWGLRMIGVTHFSCNCTFMLGLAHQWQ